MKTPSLSNSRSSVFQRGVAAVELALVAIPFFLLLFGVMEFGRLFYVWNTAQEVTRHAARQAVVTNFKDNAAMTAIRQSAVFRVNAGTLPAAPEISDLNVVIRYLNADQNQISGANMPADPGDNIAACLEKETSCIRYVEVCLSLPLAATTTCSEGQPIPFQPMIGLFATSGPNSTNLLGIRIPLSTVRMPAESLGYRAP
ncbi:TadE/TadG family type IV pilus assembly protein [Rhodoferax sp.]|jgi:hypothetical protein|uniref:TadE/TadG family type IV pilus assembly protein n=1 Tax=Rhodoferax sp. TaxID=50421 RepID=UPI00271D73CB|nr:TadE/TadG family type IV pilus assembly protein [Rhodoferax sp.]MDO9145784.1 TadE/TadG family type IV pilus assembly protein [Rhodoferax sp.]MDP1527933.1 TadE/TadG family type IV pilus assembly protein [Rhodoferax sp.]MDP1944454.1 TadE/TadG family type IV pilus assembly protein [Rhodoferax sp.]MDP2441014.1 TadE/TadG family type IV pilus assembly protein [Rhodoferax sp.]MDP3192126.1 TadE/TadG family type IV pilus assembly protein [Rhodoferax sp.]